MLLKFWLTIGNNLVKHGKYYNLKSKVWKKFVTMPIKDNSAYHNLLVSEEVRNIAMDILKVAECLQWHINFLCYDTVNQFYSRQLYFVIY